jgi:hypothetical protein
MLLTLRSHAYPSRWASAFRNGCQPDVGNGDFHKEWQKCRFLLAGVSSDRRTFVEVPITVLRLHMQHRMDYA